MTGPRRHRRHHRARRPDPGHITGGHLTAPHVGIAGCSADDINYGLLPPLEGRSTAPTASACRTRRGRAKKRLVGRTRVADLDAWRAGATALEAAH